MAISGFRRVFPGVLLIAVLAPIALFGISAKSDPAAASYARGEKLAVTCVACHGGEGLTTGSPAYHAPKLRGQHPHYLKHAIGAYRGNQRNVPLMHDAVASLSDQDIEDLSLYLAGREKMMPRPGEKHVVPTTVVQVCGACHGETGLGALPETPVLSGQRPDYIAHALRAYHQGERSSRIMRPYASALTPAQIDEVSHYFAQQGALGDLK